MLPGTAGSGDTSSKASAEAGLFEAPRFVLRLTGPNVTSVETISELPARSRLHQNFPNPFNPSTTVRYEVGTADAADGVNVRLTVYDILGRRVAVLADRLHAPGAYAVQFDASQLSSGVYLYRLEAGNRVETRSMMLIK
jgi:hypothetical protein